MEQKKNSEEFQNEKEILGFCLKNGLLIDRETLRLFSGSDAESAKTVIEKIKERTNSRIITKNVFFGDKEKTEEFFSEIPNDKEGNLQKLKIKLGLSIEISKEIAQKPKPDSSVKIVSTFPLLSKSANVKDFTSYFRNRYSEIKFFLQERPELTNLLSINKISGNRSNISVIGMVSDKRTTKNKNIILEIEDLTGKIKVLVSESKKELYEKAQDICLDSVLGFKCTGNREILFANEIFFPDASIPERKKSPVEECALFISDIHVGSKLFLEKNFLNFIDYLNGKVSNTPEIEKIKYLFVVGDLVAGVGVYPNQERDLEIKDIEGQYARFAELVSRIRKDIKIIIIPGNHDCVRLAEPQPILDERYAWPLYNLKNAILASNPSTINIGAKEGFPGFDVLMYHGFSYFYYANTVPRLIAQDSANAPDKIMQYLLQNRHLAPTHASVQYMPYEKDPLIIRNVPDIFVSGHTHAGTLSYYNNILVISSSCWEDLTPIQEKFGSKPNFCKVPMFNLKTRNVRILDFEDEEHKNKIAAKMAEK